MPLLSVVMPTHNRAQYAVRAIEAVLGVGGSDLELIVSDTSTAPDLQDGLSAVGVRLIDDPRLVYARSDGPSNLTQNHNDALAMARGDYVCVIGDDDCITSAATDAAHWAASSGTPVVSQTVKAIYAWPDFRSLMSRGGHAGRLYVPRNIGAARWRSAPDDLSRSLSEALQGTDGLPRCYHGVVRRDLLERVNVETGAFFHGSSPDMSGAIALACMIDRYCEVDLPLTISGISSGSNSGRSAMNTHKGVLSSEAQTKAFVEAGWSRGVPKFFSVETVWAHAGLSVLEKLAPERMAEFNYSRLIALCVLRHPDFMAEALQAMDAAPTPGSEELMQRSIKKEMLRERLRRARYLVRRALIPTAANGRKYFPRLCDVAVASRQYEEYARHERFQFFGL